MSIYTQENSAYLTNNSTWHVEDSAWKADQIAKMILRNKLNLSTICEIGCGVGEILNQLHSKPFLNETYFTGFEIAIDAFKLALSRKKDRLDFFQEDPLTKPVHYDLLLMIDVFEHVPEYMAFIESASKLATYKMFHIPLDMNVLGILRDSPLRDRKKLGHLHYFSKDTALETLRDCGLEIIDHFYTPGIEIDNKTLNQKILNPIRKMLFAISKDFTVKTLSGYSLLVLAK